MALCTDHISIATCSTTEQEVLDRIDAVKADVGDSRWVSPEVWAFPRIQNQELFWWPKRYIGGNRWKWGLEEDLSWFHTCPDTAWNAVHFVDYMVRALHCLHNWHMYYRVLANTSYLLLDLLGPERPPFGYLANVYRHPTYRICTVILLAMLLRNIESFRKL